MFPVYEVHYIENLLHLKHFIISDLHLANWSLNYVYDCSYATADSIIELWENLGVSQGQDILEVSGPILDLFH